MLAEQPPNSYDTNVLDLGYFRALQSHSWQLEPATTIDGLIANVEQAWNEYDPHALNRVFLTHQSCLNRIIETGGNNDYDIPHMKKSSMERAGQLPASIEISNDARSRLQEMGYTITREIM